MRLSPETRRAVIITAALVIARAHGLHRVNHGDVARLCKIETSKKLVRHYFATQVDLWKAVMVAEPTMAEQGKGLGL